MKLFADCIKDAGVQSGHVTTALGNESFRFGRNRSQPKRQTRQNRRATAAENARREGDDKESASLSSESTAKSPNLALDENDDNKSDIVRARWNVPLNIKKYVPDKNLIFGWASVIEKDGHIIIDKQEDVIEVEELENAAYEFVLNSRNHGDMHARANLGRLVESMVFTKEKQDALGIDLGQIGWWTGFKIHDKELWAAHKRGERPEFSIGGAAIPVEIEDMT